MRPSECGDNRDPGSRPRRFEQLIGNSPALEAVLDGVKRVAPTSSTVLIQGETGTPATLRGHGISCDYAEVFRVDHSDVVFVSDIDVDSTVLIRGRLFGFAAKIDRTQNGATHGVDYRCVGSDMAEDEDTLSKWVK